VACKIASVTPAANGKVYGTADPTLAGTLSGFLAGDGVTASYSRSAGETVAGGPYTISATLSPSSALSNYAITYNTGSFTITPATLTVTADSKSKVYGGADSTLTYTPSGTLYFGDTYAGVIGDIVLSTATARLPVAGSHPIKVTGGSAANYAIEKVNGTLNVSKAPLTVTADDKVKTYGGLDPNSDVYAQRRPLLRRHLRWCYQRGCLVHRNRRCRHGWRPYYHGKRRHCGQLLDHARQRDLTVLSASRPALTITVNNQSKVFGAPNPNFTASFVGFVNGETSSNLAGTLVFSTSATVNSPVGTYAVTTGGLTSSNYDITYVPAR